MPQQKDLPKLETRRRERADGQDSHGMRASGQNFKPSIRHWILWITSRHTLYREKIRCIRSTKKKTATMAIINIKLQEKKVTRPLEASTNKLRISVNQPLRRRRGHRRQPCLVGGSGNRGRIRCNRRSPFAWRWSWFSGGWRHNHRKRRGEGWRMTGRRYG